jgi:hypothetical protein
MSWYSKVTLGDLQGDKSKEQLCNCPSFIEVERNKEINGVPHGCIITEYQRGNYSPR